MDIFYPILIAFAIAGCISFLTRDKKRKKKYSERYNKSNDNGLQHFSLYRKKILSPAETCFYQVLRQMLPPGKAISVKVRLEDIMFVPPCKNKFWYRQKINCRHVDFVVFNPQNGMVDFCIELDDSSHQDRQDADRNKDSFFQYARIPLIRIPVQYKYDPRDVAAKILRTMRGTIPENFIRGYFYHWKAIFYQS